MNLTQSQLSQLETVWRLAQDKHQQLINVERDAAAQITDEENPLFQSIWEQLKAGNGIGSEGIDEAIEQLQALRERTPRTDIITRRIEAIQSIMSSQQSFLSTLTPEQELVIVDALFFLRHKLDPVANPEDFFNSHRQHVQPRPVCSADQRHVKSGTARHEHRWAMDR